MKVGTDGVLLGAWTDVKDAQTILDVGTGSGLIALMLAQRSEALIDAIDIDENACRQAEINFHPSPFDARLHIFQADFLQYAPGYAYDLIVSNPPYFRNSLKSPDEYRNIARHTGELNWNGLLENSRRLLSAKGRLSLILPYDHFDYIQSLAGQADFHLIRKTLVRPLENRPPKRILLEYAVEGAGLAHAGETDIFIEKSRHVYSQDYIELTKEYYKTINNE
jgi:tRNA1Val (adenine37-N6)-methyltransferase